VAQEKVPNPCRFSTLAQFKIQYVLVSTAFPKKAMGLPYLKLSVLVYTECASDFVAD
jgi:hypothetical protein